MPRYALKLEYHGAPYSGWQRQTSHPSVQAVVEDALRKLDPDTPKIVAAGRTDAGVHALGQVAHCDTFRDWDAFRLSEAVNFHLKPAPVAVVDCARVADDFHARFSALARHYRYRLICRRAPLTHDAGLAWKVRSELDADAMRRAAEYLLGTHDLTTFRAIGCQANSPIKTVDAIEISTVAHRWGQEMLIDVRARSFLHNQVRSFVGSLERVGYGAWSPQDLRDALDARDRNACGPVAPPEGLYLTHVVYAPDPFQR